MWALQLHWKTNLREACASLGRWKVAYAEVFCLEPLTRVVTPASPKKASKSACASLLTQESSSTDTQSAHAAYATMIIFRYCAYALLFPFPFLHSPFMSKKKAAQLNLMYLYYTSAWAPVKVGIAFHIIPSIHPKFVNGSEGWTDTSPCFGARDPTGPTPPLLPSFFALGKSDLSTRKGNANHQLMQGKVNQNVWEMWYWSEWWLMLIILMILLILKIQIFNIAPLMWWWHLLTPGNPCM